MSQALLHLDPHANSAALPSTSSTKMNTATQPVLSFETEAEEASQSASGPSEAAFRIAWGTAHNYYRPLYQATIRGDWVSARNFLESDPNALTERINIQGLTILLIAARKCQRQFVQNLVEILPPAALATQSVKGYTVLHYVALGGSLKTAKALVRKNSALPQIMSKGKYTPLLSSLSRPTKEMAWFLTMVTKDEHPSFPFTGPMSSKLVCRFAAAGFHGENY